jgi:hypothetical protein
MATVLGLAVSFGAGCGGHGVGAASAPDPQRVRVALISDLNSEYGSTLYAPEVATAIELIRERWRPDLVLAAGDLIAGQRPSLGDATVHRMWAAFDSTVAAPLRAAAIPFGFALGNHDASAYPAHERDRAVAVKFWREPERDPGVAFVDRTHFPLYYSFRSGPLFVAVWDAASATTPATPEMLQWLSGQLTGAAAQAASFRIVLGHLPLYAVAEGRDRPGEVLAEADMLRAFLERHGVHTYISGHHHAYYAGRRGNLELLHAGALGTGPRPLLGRTAPSPRTVTILDFDAASGRVSYTTHVLQDGTTSGTVEVSELPPRLEAHNGHVVRRDLPDRSH